MQYLNLLRPAWERIANSMNWTHSITISPHNPYLGPHCIYSCGSAFAKRMHDREDIGPKGILLIPERCTDGFWHYHGVVTHPLGTSAVNFAANGSCYLIKQMELQAEHTVRGARITSLPVPDVRIESRGPQAEAAVRYAMKQWTAQGKAHHAIWF